MPVLVDKHTTSHLRRPAVKTHSWCPYSPRQRCDVTTAGVIPVHGFIPGLCPMDLGVPSWGQMWHKPTFCPSQQAPWQGYCSCKLHPCYLKLIWSHRLQQLRKLQGMCGIKKQTSKTKKKNPKNKQKTPKQKQSTKRSQPCRCLTRDKQWLLSNKYRNGLIIEKKRSHFHAKYPYQNWMNHRPQTRYLKTLSWF